MADTFKCSLTGTLREIIDSFSEVTEEKDILMEVSFEGGITDEIILFDSSFSEKLNKLISNAVSRTSMGVISIEISSSENEDGTFGGQVLVKDTSETLAEGEGFINGVEGVGNIYGFDFTFEPTDTAPADSTLCVVDKEEKCGQEEVVVLPSIMDIKWDYALSILGQEALALTAAKDFYRGIPALIENLNRLYENLQSEDGFNNYKIAVHGAKGVCNTFGALELGAICRLLEFAAKADNISRIDALHPILIEELNRVIVDWAELKGNDGEKQVCDDMELLKDLISQMKDALENFELEQADEISKELAAYSYDDNMQSLIDELINAVADIDDAKGIDICTRIEEIIACQ